MSKPAQTLDCLAVVVDCLADQVGIDRDRIDPDRPLSAVPEVESIHVLRAIADVERICAVAIPDDFLFEASTVRELAAFVAQLRAQS